MIVRVEPDMRKKRFRYVIGAISRDRDSDLLSTKHITFETCRETLESIPGVEYAPRECSVPFDTAVIAEVRATLRKHGFQATASEQAIEVYKYVENAESQRRRYLGEVQDNFPADMFDHQKVTCRFAMEREYAGLLLEMGTGKTRCALELIQTPEYQGHTIVLAPKSVLPSWEKEAARWVRGPHRVFVVSGTAEQKERQLDAFVRYQQVADQTNAAQRAMGILVTNYETLRNHKLFLRLCRLPIRTIIADESIAIKNYGAKRTRAAWKLAHGIPRRLILTGEPMSQGIEDLFGQLGFLSPDILGRKKGAFMAAYCNVVDRNYGAGSFQEIVGYKHLDALSAKVFRHCIQFQKHECLDLPPKTYQERHVMMGPDQKRAYKRMADEFVTQVEGEYVTANGVLPQTAKLTQITAGFAYTESGGAVAFKKNGKLDAFMEIVQEVTPSGKLVVWVRFKAEVSVIRAALAFSKIGHVYLDGSLSTAERGHAVEAFQTDPTKRVFIGQIQAAGLGLTLTAASTAVFMTNSWSLSERKQAEDRIHRIGQNDPCLYVDLICPGTIDVAIVEALTRKADLARRVTKKEWGRIVKGES